MIVPVLSANVASGLNCLPNVFHVNSTIHTRQWWLFESFIPITSQYIPMKYANPSVHLLLCTNPPCVHEASLSVSADSMSKATSVLFLLAPNPQG